jgi:AcrR family transcriptional regulator
MRLAVPTQDDANHAATRRQLLAAAAEVFAAAGFQAATVRSICQRAGANIAAVNYHFGDKAALYRAVLKMTGESALAKYPPDFELTKDATPEQRLRAFVHSFLLRIFSEGPEALHGKLMAREMIEPTDALDEIVADKIRPMAKVLKAIVEDLAGRKLDEQTVRMCSMSVVSQVLFYHHCRPVVQRLFGIMKFDAAVIEGISEHITQFSLAAIKQIGQKPRK